MCHMDDIASLHMHINLEERLVEGALDLRRSIGMRWSSTRTEQTESSFGSEATGRVFRYLRRVRFRARDFSCDLKLTQQQVELGDRSIHTLVQSEAESSLASAPCGGCSRPGFFLRSPGSIGAPASPIIVGATTLTAGSFSVSSRISFSIIFKLLSRRAVNSDFWTSLIFPIASLFCFR